MYKQIETYKSKLHYFLIAESFLLLQNNRPVNNAINKPNDLTLEIEYFQ